MWLNLLLSNIRSIGMFAAIAAAFSAGMWVEAQFAKDTLKSALSEQETALKAQCQADKELTSKVGREYETKISTLNSRVSQLKRLQSTKCVPVTSSAGIANGSAATGHANVDAINSGDLIDYAGEAEKQRQQLISLQEFVRRAIH